MADKANPNCPQCKGCGQVADTPAYPKPAWVDWVRRPRSGPDPLTDFIQPTFCPQCYPEATKAKEKAEEDKKDDLDEEGNPVSPAPTPAPTQKSEWDKAVDSIKIRAEEYRAKAKILDDLAVVLSGMSNPPSEDHIITLLKELK